MSVVIIGGHDRMVSQYKKGIHSDECQPGQADRKTGSFSSVHQYRFPQNDPLRLR